MSPPDHHQPAASEPGSARQGSERRMVRWAVNAWLVFHVSAIIIAPASVAPSSDLIQAAWGVFQPYLQLLYLNHGYHFFAPEPSESTLLAFAAERTDGTVVRGRIPSPSMHPRLLFHRHFMLTEHMRDAPEELQQEWVGSYAQHICHKYGAVRVSLTGQLHNLPTMEMVRAGVRLNDPTSYENEPFGVFEWVPQ
ncbi:MAG: hypothetical protein ACHRXM_16610 [Isosphaerales bacterium]